ncbi:MAG: hypothetical protein N4A45_00770 [Flavobacteriales bacterium]|jgi:hypothetical protein|nr:hypothetical protein [Flavobacteriales bacterium]
MVFRLLNFLLLGVLFSSCGFFAGDQEARIIARYNDENLLSQVIDDAVPKNLSPKDSIVFVKHFVNQWARKQAILEHAVFNLSDEDLNIDQLVENYRSSLIRQRFEQDYLNQKMDTVVTREQKETYYQKYQEVFLLKESIARIRYIRVGKVAPDIEELKERLEVQDEDDEIWLIDYANQFAKRHYFKTDIWVKINDFVEELPIDEFQKNILYNTKKVLQFEDEKDYFLLKIVDYKIKNQIPPLNYVQEQVQSLILHQRKKQMLQELENVLFEKALKEGKFEFY